MPKPLALQQTENLTVYAEERWNQSGVLLETGATYQFEVVSYPLWKDGIIHTDPNGFFRWWLSPFSFLTRMPSAKWFELIGTIGRDEVRCFKIGKGREYSMEGEAGELFLFANDISFMYYNNEGSLRLSVKRTA